MQFGNGHSAGRMYISHLVFICVPFYCIFQIFFFALFLLAGWSKRATIARGSQRGSKDLVAISLSFSLSLSLAVVATHTAENEPSKVFSEIN